MNMPNKFSDPKKGKKNSNHANVLEEATVYRTMMENSFIPLCIFDSRGEILDFSSAVTMMLGCSREKLLGKKINDYLSSEGERGSCLKIKKQLLREGIYTGEIELKTFDGQIKQVGYTACCLRENLFMACIRDDPVRPGKKYLKEEYIYIMSRVSHELRRPLATISACLDLFHVSFQNKLEELKRFHSGDINERELSLNQDFHYLTIAAQSVEQMAALINSILDLAKLDLEQIILNKQKIILEDLLEAVIKETQLTDPDKRIVLLEAEKKGSLAVEADPVQIREVLENLVSNAIKYSPPGGEIVITAGKRKGYALISIRDQGLGIASEDQPQIFKRFYMVPQAKQLGLGGLGLGLYISKQLIELHQGQIWLESKEGEGSTFYFTLPLLSSNEN